MRRLGLLFAAVLLASCGEGARTFEFSIVSGSENRSFEPIVQDFCKAQRVACAFSFKGSVDIGMAVADKASTFDAVWPANGLWIDLFDRERRVRGLQPIARSPVILGLKRSKAEELGWIGREVAATDIVEAVRAKRLRFLASSATQSHSGAGAYLAMLSAALGHPETIALADLQKEDVRETVRVLLAGVARTAGSSAWLADLYVQSLEQGVDYDGMWNYEAVIAETNDVLKGKGQGPLYAIYPTDGVAFADAPLGFVDRGRGQQVQDFFFALQKHLLSPEVQSRLVALHRRPALGEAAAGRGDAQTNLDPARFVTYVRMPESTVIRAALDLYQETLRRPSFTVYCLDYSGSMGGKGEQELEEAIRFLFSREKAAELMAQHSPADRIMVIPFDAVVRPSFGGRGSAADQERLLAQTLAESPNGGTAMHLCASAGLDAILQAPDRDAFLPAIVIMTDGKSNDDPNAFLEKWRGSRAEIPVFGITFGDADRKQVEALSEATRGRTFDGAASLRDAFRTVRGYN